MLHAGCSAFSFPEILEVQKPISPSTIISIKLPVFYTMRLFDYNPLDSTRSYIAGQITHTFHLFSKISKKPDPEEETTMRPVVNGKILCEKQDARLESVIFKVMIL